MELCKTDCEKLLKLLEFGQKIISENCIKPCEIDKGRQMRQFIKKMKTKMNKHGTNKDNQAKIL